MNLFKHEHPGYLKDGPQLNHHKIFIDGPYSEFSTISPSADIEEVIRAIREYMKIKIVRNPIGKVVAVSEEEFNKPPPCKCCGK